MALIFKKKPALLLTVGTAVGLVAGGATAWWLLQRHTPISELPVGADVLPQNTAMSFSFSTDAGQWRRLRQFGTSDTQASFDKTLVEWRDRLFTQNGINYQQEIQPWVGEEVTVAFLAPADAAGGESDTKQIQPYRPLGESGFDRSAVMIFPIANPARAQQLLTSPQVTESQEWADRDYKGVQIREVHGSTELDYAAAVLDNRLLVASGDAQSIEQVIDTFKGSASVAQNTDYGRAFSQLRQDVVNPFMRMYINVPLAIDLTTSNPNQPLSPQLLAFLQQNQGLAADASLESDGVRFRGATWIAPNSKLRLKGGEPIEQIPLLLPDESVLVASGDNLQQFWADYSQPIDASANQTLPNNFKTGFLNPAILQQSFKSFTGLELDKEVMSWAKGEFSLALLSASAATPESGSTAGIVLLVQVSDRPAAEETFKKLDQVMQERHSWRVEEAKLEDQPVTTWTSRFAGLTVTRGWLNGDVVFLAIGPGTANALIPAPDKALASTDLFRAATQTNLEAPQGNFFMAVDRLANPNVSLPVPALPDANRAVLNAIRAIGLTTTVQDSRTLRFEGRTVLQRSENAPAALPAPGETVPAASPADGSESSPEAEPSE